MAIDPICKMHVEEKTAKWVSDYKGQKFYFCAPGCKRMFDKDPDKWAGGSGAPHKGCNCCM